MQHIGNWGMKYSSYMRLYPLHRGSKKNNANRTNNVRAGRDLMKENWKDRKTAKHGFCFFVLFFYRSYDFLAIVLLSQITLAFLDFCMFVCLFRKRVSL